MFSCLLWRELISVAVVPFSGRIHGGNSFNAKARRGRESPQRIHFKKREHAPFASFLAYLCVFALSFSYSRVKTYSLSMGNRSD